MNDTTCPVDHLLKKVERSLLSGEIKIPRARVIVEKIAVLIRDISNGHSGIVQLSKIVSLSSHLVTGDFDRSVQSMGEFIRKVVKEEHGIFVRHIKTRTCVSKICKNLIAAPCRMACPAGIDIPSYLFLIGMEEYGKAIDLIRKDCPFPWVCGLVCTRPCEAICVRKRVDTPISIKSLKGFAAKRAIERGQYKNPEKAQANGKKVCVVGAGPAGLSAAYYLSLKGYEVSVFESAPKAGGMLLLGIPRYRLPEKVIDYEVSMLKSLGVTFYFNTYWGRDETFESLKARGFDVFFIGIGAHQSLRLNIKGERNFPQVIDAIAFLRGIALKKLPRLGKKVVVVGGGNVAIDSARSALRLGAKEVRIVYRRDRSQMPADIEEIEHAEEEGVQFSFLTVPIEVMGEKGQLTGVKCLRVKLEKKKDQDRAYPYSMEGSDFTIPSDFLILAIGQRVEETVMADLSDLTWTRRGTIVTDSFTTQTAIPGIFAGGDVVTGPATVIEAINAGKKAANAIHRYFLGTPQPTLPDAPRRHQKVTCHSISSHPENTRQRPKMPLLDMTLRKTTFEPVEKGFSKETATNEALRCLRCDICIRCGKCVEVCRSQMGIDALSLGYFNEKRPSKTDFTITQKKCILCGACAANCPTGAMSVTDANGKRVLTLCGTILNMESLIRCDTCNEAIAPLCYLEFIKARTKKVPAAKSHSFSCERCARQRMAYVKPLEAL